MCHATHAYEVSNTLRKDRRDSPAVEPEPLVSGAENQADLADLAMAAGLHACAPFDPQEWELGLSRRGTRSRTTLATDSASGARVALKMLQSGPINPDSVDHLNRELEVARYLEAAGALQDPRAAHLALPSACYRRDDGGLVLHYAAQLEPFEWQNASRSACEWWRVVEQLLSGLQLLASHGLYHADIVRPYTHEAPYRWIHNVMQASSGAITIIDMGEVFGGGKLLPRWERGCAEAGGGGGGSEEGATLGKSWEEQQGRRREEQRRTRRRRRLGARERAEQRPIWLGRHVEACDWNPNKVVS